MYPNTSPIPLFKSLDLSMIDFTQTIIAMLVGKTARWFCTRWLTDTALIPTNVPHAPQSVPLTREFKINIS